MRASSLVKIVYVTVLHWGIGAGEDEGRITIAPALYICVTGTFAINMYYFWN